MYFDVAGINIPESGPRILQNRSHKQARNRRTPINRKMTSVTLRDSSVFIIEFFALTSTLKLDRAARCCILRYVLLLLLNNNEYRCFCGLRRDVLFISARVTRWHCQDGHRFSLRIPARLFNVKGVKRAYTVRPTHGSRTHIRILFNHSFSLFMTSVP